MDQVVRDSWMVGLGPNSFSESPPPACAAQTSYRAPAPTRQRQRVERAPLDKSLRKSFHKSSASQPHTPSRALVSRARRSKTLPAPRCTPARARSFGCRAFSTLHFVLALLQDLRVGRFQRRCQMLIPIPQCASRIRVILGNVLELLLRLLVPERMQQRHPALKWLLLCRRARYRKVHRAQLLLGQGFMLMMAFVVGCERARTKGEKGKKNRHCFIADLTAAKFRAGTKEGQCRGFASPRSAFASSFGNTPRAWAGQPL